VPPQIAQIFCFAALYTHSYLHACCCWRSRHQEGRRHERRREFRGESFANSSSLRIRSQFRFVIAQPLRPSSSSPEPSPQSSSQPPLTSPYWTPISPPSSVDDLPRPSECQPCTGHIRNNARRISEDGALVAASIAPIKAKEGLYENRKWR
ncbi:hypothetical protein GYMLUDRAFT_1025601, partial [Collybiopsis luxurians FD-317 M1]